MDKVSIVLPVYNCEKTILKAINSVLEQTYQNFELIIVNDGSVDHTEDEVLKVNDCRIKYIKKENSGVSDTRNIGIRNSTGEFIFFIDADDVYKKDYLEQLLKYKNFDIVATGFVSKRKKFKRITMHEFETNSFFDFFEKLQPKQLYNQVWNKMFKSSIIRENNIIFDSRKNIAEDYEFVVKYCKCCKNYKYINDCLYIYKVSPNGLCFSKNEKSSIYKQEILECLNDEYSLQKHNNDYLKKLYIKLIFNDLCAIFKEKKHKSIKKEMLLSRINNKSVFSIDELLSLKSKKYRALVKVLKSRNYFLIFSFCLLISFYDKIYKKIMF